MKGIVHKCCTGWEYSFSWGSGLIVVKVLAGNK